MYTSPAAEEPKTLAWGFRLVLIASALFIAGCSAFFSVRGLGLLFVGSEIPVMVMAASLEVGKLVAASFLYRYWDRINGAMRFYLTLAVVLLIGITSLGNYGYLARAYEKTTTQIQRNELEIAALEKEILDVQHRIDDSRGRNNRLSTASREDLVKAQTRLTQANDVLAASLVRLQEQGQGKVTISDAEIEKLHKTVAERNRQIHDLRDQIAAADIVSYRFVARAFDAEADDVVKWLMLALVAVFDPLAVTLVVAFNMAVQGRRKALPESEPVAGGRPSRGGRSWTPWEIAVVVILGLALALIVAWAWATEVAVITVRPDDFRQKSTKAFPEWLERTGGKGMSAAFGEFLKYGLVAHTDIQVFAKFPDTAVAGDAEHPSMLCGAVVEVTDPFIAEAALSRIADQVNEAIRGESGRPPSNLMRSRAMIRHGEGRYMDPEGGFFTFGLTNRTAIILVEFEGNPRAPGVEQEIRSCLARTARPGEKARERLPDYVGEQAGALTLWLDAGRFFRRLPMGAETRRGYEQLKPSLDFETLLSLTPTGNDSLSIGGKYLYQFDRFAEGSPRDPLAVLAKISPPKEADLAWKLINRGVDTLDYAAMVERLRGALGDDRSPVAQRVLVEKSVPSAREARFTMNARFDPKAGPPVIAAMSLLSK